MEKPYITRPTLGYLTALLLIGFIALAPAYSQQPPPPAAPPQPNHPAIEPDALDR
jgi:hypothetical protein